MSTPPRSIVGRRHSIGGKASDENISDENIEQYGEVTKNKNGAEMLMFLKNEMKTLDDKVKEAGPE